MNKKKVPSHPSFLLLLLLLVLAALVFRYFWCVADWFVPPSVLHENPQVADKIAAASALFSAFAFVGLLYTILLQRHELLAQRSDQEDLQAQVAQQAFEGTFFQLLRFHHDNVHSQTVQIVDAIRSVHGRLAFAAAADELERFLTGHSMRNPAQPLQLADINRIYSSVCETRRSDFGHYFRNLYHIVKYIDESEVRDRARYASQVRAQLSQPEFVLLLANGLRRGGKSKFKPLIEKYALLHEMRPSATLEPMMACYQKSAFGIPEPTT